MNILIAYWSGTGNTEAMSNAVAQGVEKAGKHADVVHVADQPDVSAYDYIIFGCPAMGAEVLEESEFEPFFMQAEGNLMNKKVALFGSYGWGSGEWMQSWEERVEAAGANLFENGLIINYTPDAAGLDACESLGERFANA